MAGGVRDRRDRLGLAPHLQRRPPAFLPRSRLLNSYLAFDTGCAITAVQVTGPFDRSPLSVPSREVNERSTAGTSQVSRRSASWKLVYPRPVVAFCSPCADQARAAARRGQTNAIPRCQQGSRECPWIPGPRVGQTLDPPVIFREPDGLFTGDSWHRNPRTSGSVNRPLPLPRPKRSAQMHHQAGSMIGPHNPESNSPRGRGSQLTGRFRR
jgi:hypothetical protein